MDTYQSIKAEMLARAMDDENINLEHFKRRYQSAMKVIDESAKEQSEAQKLEAVEKLVYESFWNDGKFGSGFETAARDVSDLTSTTGSAITNAAADKLVQPSVKPSANLDGIPKAPVLQTSMSGNIQPAMGGLLRSADEEAMYAFSFDPRGRGIPYSIGYALNYNNISGTGRILGVKLRYVSGSEKDKFIVMPRDPEVFRENPRIGHQILQDAHAFLVYWHWYLKNHESLRMFYIAQYWLEPGNPTVWKYHSASFGGLIPRFDIAAHKLALSYRAADAQKSKKRKR